MALLRPVSPALTALALLALIAPPRLDLDAAAVDAHAATQGLRARVHALDDWSITVRDLPPSASTSSEHALEVEVSLRAPDGRGHRRRLPLAGPTVEDRSRELAASLALLIEQWDDLPVAERPFGDPSIDPAADPAPTVDTPRAPRDPPRARAWLGLGPRLELARSPPEGGIDLLLGAWLLREHLQPLLSLGWGATARAGLSLHTLRFGAGVAAGSPLARGRLWLGAHAVVHALWARAHDRRSETLWASSSELGGTLQVRGARWHVGLRTGLDLALPELRVRGDRARLRRGPVQWVLGVSFGVIFGGLRNSRGQVGR